MQLLILHAETIGFILAFYWMNKIGIRDHKFRLQLQNIITFAKVDMFSSLFVCLLATLDLHEIFTEGWQWASEQMITFRWRFRSRIRIRTLVRRALAKVCTAQLKVLVQVRLQQQSRS